MNPNKSEFKFAQKINLLLTRIAFAVGSVAQVSKPSFLRLNFKFKIKWNGINCSWRDRSSVKAILWRKLLYRRPQNRPTAINTIYTLSLGGNKLCFLFDFTTFTTFKGSPLVKSSPEPPKKERKIPWWTMAMENRNILRWHFWVADWYCQLLRRDIVENIISNTLSIWYNTYPISFYSTFFDGLFIDFRSAFPIQ